MRAFLALLPDRDSALEIDAWRARAWTHIGRAVPVQQLHLTLCFLGEADARRIDTLASSLDALPPGALAHPYVADGRRLRFDTPGWRPDSGVAWLEPSGESGAFAGLVRRLRGIAAHAALRTDKRPHRPHITLARGVHRPPPAPLMAPSIGVVFGPVTLVESQRGAGGARYETLASWP